MVDQSTTRIEHQLNDELSLDESRQIAGENPLLSGRSKSVPPDLNGTPHDSAENYVLSTSNRGARPHEISMAQLSHA
jgi:hypothetical protein